MVVAKVVVDSVDVPVVVGSSIELGVAIVVDDSVTSGHYCGCGLSGSTNSSRKWSS